MDSDADLTTDPCLFCLRTGRQPSIEHVIPAGLGRHADVKLPRGAVCEPCNNELGRQIDEALVHLFEVRFIRGLHGVADQKGRRITRLELSNHGKIEFHSDGGLEITVHRDVVRRDDNSIVVTAGTNRSRFGDQLRRATRSILKLGLNLAYLESPAFALSDRWNPARDAIRGKPYVGYLLVGPFEIYKPPDLEAQLLFDVPGATAVARLQFGGLELLADLAPGAASQETRSWARARELEVMDIAPKLGT